MPRWLWILLTFIISSGIYLSVRYGLRPKAIAMINPTVISEPSEMGALVYRRIRESIRTEKILFFGYNDVKIFSVPFIGFVKTAAADGLTYKTVIEVANGTKSDELSNILSPLMAAYWRVVPPEKLAVTLREVLANNQTAIVIVPVEEATHLERTGLIKHVEGELKSPIMAINFLPFYVSEAELNKRNFDCMKSKEEMTAKDKLDCASYKISRKFLRKKLDEAKFFIALEWHGLKEYLAYLHTP